MTDWREICTVDTDQGPATLTVRVDDAEHGGVVDFELLWSCGDADIVQGFTMSFEEALRMWETIVEGMIVGDEEGANEVLL